MLRLLDALDPLGGYDIVCPSCGSSLSVEKPTMRLLCGKCGQYTDNPVLSNGPTQSGKTPISVTCSKCNAELPADSLFCNECGAPAKVAPTKTVEPAPTIAQQMRTQQRQQTSNPAVRWHAPVARMLLGVVLSVGVSASFPYLFYLASSVKLDPNTSLDVIFVLGILIAFGVVTLPLLARRTPTPPQAAAIRVGSTFCAGCGSKLAGDDKFCARCGAPNT